MRWTTILLTLFCASAWLPAAEVTVIREHQIDGNVRDATWDGTHLWFGENGSSTINKMDPQTGEILMSFLAGGANPFGLAWTGEHLYNCNYEHEEFPDVAYKMSPDGTPLGNWEIPGSPVVAPNGAAYDPATGHLWISDWIGGMLHEVEPADGSVVSSIVYPGASVRGLTWHDGHVIAVDDQDSRLYKLDPSTGAVIDSVSIATLGPNPEGLAFDGRYFWVTDIGTGTIYQVHAAFLDPVADIMVNALDGPLDLTPDDEVRVTLNLAPGALDGDQADWWLYAERNGSPSKWWAQRNSRGGLTWTRSTTPLRLVGGPLRSIAGRRVLGPTTLPRGNWVFHFAVDENKDGVYDGSIADSVHVTVE